MLRPGFPRLSHPEVAHAIPSVGFIAQVYRRVRLLVSPTIVGVQLTDQQRTAQAPLSGSGGGGSIQSWSASPATLGSTLTIGRLRMPFNTRIEDWLQVIRGEFHETPDLRVTLDQAETRWDLDHKECGTDPGNVRGRRVPPAFSRRIVLSPTAASFGPAHTCGLQAFNRVSNNRSVEPLIRTYLKGWAVTP